MINFSDSIYNNAEILGDVNTHKNVNRGWFKC